MHLPVVSRQTRDVTAQLAQSAHPRAPVRAAVAAPAARRRSPGAARRAAATVLRRSADRLAPVIE